MSTRTTARTYNQNHIAAQIHAGKRRMSIYWTWSYPWEAQRDPAAMENRFSTMTEVRNVAVAGVRNARVERGELPAGDRRHPRAVSSLDAQLPADRRGGHRPRGGGVPAHRPGGLPAADR